jgi:hypothetical protein
VSREVCLLISKAGHIVWSDASTSPLALPDSRARWEAIWSNREQLHEIVHSHPLGPRSFSTEDETTMQAVDAALGRPLRYSVLAPSGLYVRENGRDFESDERPWWVPLLALASGLPLLSQERGSG